MHEIELKFQVPPDRRDEVDRFVAGRTPVRRVRLQAAYFDTADRALARAGLALRVRREGRRWVQTLKGAGQDGMTRLEHDVPLTAAAGERGALPTVDPDRHAGTEVGERLQALLKSLPDGALACAYRTDIWRRVRTARSRLGSVELAFDEGQLMAGDRRWPVCELEIEGLSGSPLAVVEAARQAVSRLGLWLDQRSKAERGDLLSRGMDSAPARRAQPVGLRSGMSPAQALREALLSCLDQVGAAASQVASGVHGAEHVHQLRVGLRRLRVALRFFRDGLPDETVATLDAGAAALSRELGAVRDGDVMAGGLAQALQSAWTDDGLPGVLPRLVPSPPAEAAAAAVRGAAAQQLLLDLLGAVQVLALPEAEAPASAPPRRLARTLARRLTHWHRSLCKEAARFDTLDVLARHAFRKRVKRLRYAIAFSVSLFKPRAVRATLRPLKRLQAHLGGLNDVAVAREACRVASDTDPGTLFMRGWLAAREVTGLQTAAPLLAAFVATPAPGRKQARRRADRKD